MLRRVTLGKRNRRFGGSIAFVIKVTRIGELGTTLAVTSSRRTPMGLRGLICDSFIFLLYYLLGYNAV
jgi:hypothetical protein